VNVCVCSGDSIKSEDSFDVNPLQLKLHHWNPCKQIYFVLIYSMFLAVVTVGQPRNCHVFTLNLIMMTALAVMVNIT